MRRMACSLGIHATSPCSCDSSSRCNSASWGNQIADYSLPAGRCWPVVEARGLAIRQRPATGRRCTPVRSHRCLLPLGYGPHGAGFWTSAWSRESAPACVDVRETSWWCRGRRGRRLPARHGAARRRRNRSDERVPQRPPSGRAEEYVDGFCPCSGSLYQCEWSLLRIQGDGPAWCLLAGLLGSRLLTVSSSAAQPSTPQRREARAQRGLTIRRQ